LHLLDLSRLDKVFQDYIDIRHELEVFSDLLKQKEEIIVFSKADLLDNEMKQFILDEFKKKYKDKKIFIISSATREGIDELIDYLIDTYTTKIEDDIQQIENSDDLMIFDLKNNVDPRKVIVEYL
jgi:GTPase involved in cell partitioning and DNA repair